MIILLQSDFFFFEDTDVSCCAGFFFSAFPSALLMNAPGMFIIITLCSLTGLVLYARFADCDPLANKDVGNPNQVC